MGFWWLGPISFKTRRGGGRVHVFGLAFLVAPLMLQRALDSEQKEGKQGQAKQTASASASCLNETGTENETENNLLGR